MTPDGPRDPPAVGTGVCPRCGATVHGPLAPGDVCAACEARGALTPVGTPARRVVIARDEIDRAWRLRRGERTWSAWGAARRAGAIAAAALAALAWAFVAPLLGDSRLPDIDVALESVGAAALRSLLAGCAAALVGAATSVAVARSRSHRSIPLAVASLAALLAGGGAAAVGAVFGVGTLSYSFDHRRMPAVPADMDRGTARLAASTVVLYAPAAEGGGVLRSAIGMGTVVGRKGSRVVVLTCGHVAMPYETSAAWRDPARSEDLRVSFADGTTATGRIRWFAPPPVDIALVEAEASSPPEPVVVAGAEGLEAGATVSFLANPYRKGWVVHSGRVVMRRQHDTPTGRYRLVVTDLPVQSGDSGSGLFDSTGRLVGVNTWRFESGAGVQGISLPSDGLDAAIRGVLDGTVGPSEDAIVL